MVHMYCVCDCVRVQERHEPRVLDTMAVWFISLLASTAQAALPSAPHLRNTIISHSRYDWPLLGVGI